MQVCFLTEVDLRFLHKFSDKEKQAWQLIISSLKAFDCLLSTFS